MSDERVELQPLAAREPGAADDLNALQADALDLKNRVDELGREITDLEQEAALLTDRMFDITVQESGAMDLQNAPLLADTDDAQQVFELAEERADGMHEGIQHLGDGLIDVRAELSDVEVELSELVDRADALTPEVDGLRDDDGDSSEQGSEDDAAGLEDGQLNDAGHTD